MSHKKVSYLEQIMLVYNIDSHLFALTTSTLQLTRIQNWFLCRHSNLYYFVHIWIISNGYMSICLLINQLRAVGHQIINHFSSACTLFSIYSSFSNGVNLNDISVLVWFIKVQIKIPSHRDVSEGLYKIWIGSDIFAIIVPHFTPLSPRQTKRKNKPESKARRQ